MAEKNILCAYGIDVDAVAGWLGSYGGADSPDDISRGLFAGEVGTPRLLTLFERFGIKTTWFIPGHSIQTFPEQMKAIVEAGHEIGIHGYSHENPIAMTPEQEEAVLDYSIDLATALAGKRPTGYVAPWWEFSPVTANLLLSKGITYDHSLMHHDFQPYYVRVGDRWTPIDYAKRPDEWMKPLVRGQETDLIEIPASWYLDDLPPMMFIKKSPNSHGFVNPRHLEEMWRDQFDWVYREYDYAVFTMTIHPDVSGRPQVLLMHERLYAHIMRHPGVRFCTFDDIAADFARRHPRSRCVDTLGADRVCRTDHHSDKGVPTDDCVFFGHHPSPKRQGCYAGKRPAGQNHQHPRPASHRHLGLQSRRPDGMPVDGAFARFSQSDHGPSRREHGHQPPTADPDHRRRHFAGHP